MNKGEIYRKAFVSQRLQPPVFAVKNTLIKGYDFLYNILKDLLDRHNDERDMINTPFYLWGLRSLNEGRWFYECKNEQDILNRQQEVIKLYESIKSHGYCPMAAKHWDDKRIVTTYPISVRFDEDGEIQVCDGNHRLAILKYLGIETDVDCAITNSHLALDTEKTGISRGDFQLPQALREINSGDNMYHPCNEVDIRVRQFNLWRRDCQERFDHIKQYCSGKTVLDIGCSEGYFSYSLAKAGHKVTALEVDKRRLAITRYLSLKQNLDLEYVLEDWREFLQGGRTFDNILMLSTWHHSVLNEGLDRSLEALELFRNKCHTLIIETPIDSQKISWTDKSKKDLFSFTQLEFRDILEERTHMDNIAIWKGSIGRSMFVLKKAV